MMWIRYSLGLLATLVFAAASYANGQTDLRAKLRLGDFAAAYAEAEQSKTADGQALAAEILLTEIMLGFSR